MVDPSTGRAKAVRAGEWIAGAEARLREAGVASPRLEAQVLAAHVAGISRSMLIADTERELDAAAAENLLQRRATGEPLAYILGWREFYGRRFQVTPAVLIPRQETETLVETALEWLDDRPSARVLDLGTGSGCLAITLKLERPAAILTASDLSSEALKVAIANAQSHAAAIEFIQGRWFESMGGHEFDLIVSNPPYIGVQEDLPLEVRGHEPQGALFSGPTGFESYETITAQAGAFLPAGGGLVVEVGFRQAARVREIFIREGWTLMESRTDLSGVERVLSFSSNPARDEP